MTDTQFNSLTDKKAGLQTKVANHQQQALGYMGDTSAPDHPDRRKVPNAEPEHAELGLPSSYTAKAIHSGGLTSMAELEYSMRCATCDDALQCLRNLLGAKAITLKFIRKNLSGEHAITKSESKLREHNKKIAAVQWRYNNSRAALLRIGMSEGDDNIYQPITQDDLKYLKVYLEEESGKVGEGFRNIPWLWRTSRSADEEEWQVAGAVYLPCRFVVLKSIIALKTEWFRSRERYMRWEEELIHLKKEMMMARNSFRSLETIWRFKSESRSNRPGMAEYAAKKAHFYWELGRQLYRTCEGAMQVCFILLVCTSH